MSRSLSGSCARLGQPFETIYPIYIDRLNAIDGIIIDGQPCKVELEVLNDGSDKDSLIENTDALIQDIADGGVHFLWGCTPCAEFIETQAI
ncbi:MAG: hypothetical protein HXY36_00145 [Chloroflexi bacterium]|nr:hypothetical protein [Chloroflexota bacterium]